MTKKVMIAKVKVTATSPVTLEEPGKMGTIPNKLLNKIQNMINGFKNY